MKTFSIQTLGCKVNHYESEQIAALLRSRGLIEASGPAGADLRIVHTCSVTTQAASQSRQAVRRVVRLPMLSTQPAPTVARDPITNHASGCEQCGHSRPAAPCASPRTSVVVGEQPSGTEFEARRARVVVTGCWATSDKTAAAAIGGVDAVIGHHDDLAGELDRLLAAWHPAGAPADHGSHTRGSIESSSPKSVGDDSGWMIQASTRAGQLTSDIEAKSSDTVNLNLARSGGAVGLPLLDARQVGRQRAMLKIQDGCDAHCTYCIIPKLRPTLWSKPADDAVREASALVAAGHVEIVLTGIFLGAYGQPTALRRRQPGPTAKPLGELIDALCTRVPGLRRLRLSSLEPGDVTDELIAVLRDHPQVVPHFHLPLQSGSDALLRRMNRQYTRDDFLRMVDRVRAAFDRPALTTDVVAGFPGESDDEFERTVEVCTAAGFIHVHAFPYSPRPGTAAARWTKQFVRGPVVNERIARLGALAAEQSFAFRSSFIGQTVEVIVEREPPGTAQDVKRGRCERYFPVSFTHASARAGDAMRVRVTRVTKDETLGAFEG